MGYYVMDKLPRRQKCLLFRRDKTLFSMRKEKMQEKQITPYGSWQSPISSDLIVADVVALGDIVLDGEKTYWLESRPSDAGRSVVVAGEDITPQGYSVLSRVHEYGGGAYTVHAGVVYFVNLADQGVYRQTTGAEPAPLCVRDGLRFADLCVDARAGRLIAVCEDYNTEGEPVNSLVAIGLTDGRLSTLAKGADFYSSPALNDDASRLAWLSWNHPNMPWDGTELWLAELAADGGIDLSPSRSRCVAGGAEESLFQPQWGPDGALYFASDRSDWWNLYRCRAGGDDTLIEALYPLPAEFALPQWVFAMSTYGFDDAGNIICAYRRDGNWTLARLDPDSKGFTAFQLPFTDIGGIRCQGRRAVFHAASATDAAAVVQLDLDSTEIKTLRRSSALAIDGEDISVAEPISFATTGGRTAHAFYYPPKNAKYRAASDELPPLLVKSHGGPTASTSSAFNPGIQYWTSRGFAVVDVNYGGSTGYGRDYRRQLDGQWGVVDVDDCAAAARFLIDTARADAARCAIRGNSAGGYTTLAALTFRELFRAGASYYGISDLQVLAQDTHKFESRYLDRLIGPYPQAKALYEQRSPLMHCDGLSAPVIFFQGLEDKVVPPNQAEVMVDALRRKGVAVAYVPFAGERHGFRQAANIKRALEAELYFYSRIFGFALADSIEPVPIDNLADS